MMIYHLLIDRFTGNPAVRGRGFKGGTLRGVIQHLDYIQNLGADAILLSPFLKTVAYHGYHWTTDSCEIEPRFGTEKDLLELIGEVHRRGMKLVADFVPNHCHVSNPLVSRHPSWFKHDAKGQLVGYFGYREMPCFDLDVPEASDFMISMALRFSQWGFDALRIDHATGPSYGFLMRLHSAIQQQFPAVKIIGEVVGAEDFILHDTTRSLFRQRAKSYGLQEARQMEYIGILDGVLDYRYYGILYEVLSNIRKGSIMDYGQVFNDPKLIRRIRRHFANYPADFDLWLFLDNHDVDRALLLCQGSRKLLKAAIAFTRDWAHPFILYYGTEKGLTNHRPLSASVPYDDEHVRPCMPW